MIGRFICGVVGFVVFGFMAWQPAHAAVHLWDVAEIYSNADGAIQFIEITTTSNSQTQLSGHDLTATSDGNTVVFTIPGNLTDPTANQRVLFATSGFAALAGGVSSDYILPAGFFDPSASTITIDFAAVDAVTFSSVDLPVDGIRSLNADLTTGLNSPTNFAGQSGFLTGGANLSTASFW